MRFFLDTTEPEEARQVRDWGLLDGLLVRPEAAEVAGKEYRRAVADLAALCDGPVVAVVSAAEAKGMYKEARELHKHGKSVVLRVPMTREGLRVVRLLSDEQIAADVGLVFTPMQALLAARAGAAYVSPSAGALDETGQVGMDVVESIIRIYDNYGLQTQIAVQGIQNPIHALDAATMGADVAVLPFGVLEKLFDHPLTKAGVALLRSAETTGPRRIH
ncbi:fructose-6-phosphate aldolase [Acidobacteria bacterium ACD]|nr:MAG: fructose-6-phosphate aldolase [Acidobacteriota bacterium]MCE7959318.1 fructose-6-phosphate aldolase [Acidobacteria bacterium ACB2]MDL1949146.1 fructose-6-phosphate aldolase [Acidobacteria bacterium ACD]